MSHLDDERLSRLLDGELDPAELAEATRHVESCASCRERLSALAADDRVLRSTLSHDPGEAYFDSFASRVEDRLRLTGTRAAPPPEREPGILARILTFLLSSEGLAWSGVAATIVVGAGIVMLVGRETPLSTLRDTRVDERVQSQAAPPVPPASESAPRQVTGPDEKDDERARDKNEAGNFAQKPQADAAREARPADGRVEVTPDAKRTVATVEEGQVAKKQDLAKENTAPVPAARAQQVKRGAGEDFPVTTQAAPPAPAKTSEVAGTRSGTGFKSKAHAESPLAATAREEDSAAGATADQLKLEFKDLGSRVCGTVRDRNGRPVSGAQVVIVDLGSTAVTAADGSYCVKVSPGRHQVSVLALGFQSVRHDLEVEGAVRDYDVALDAVAVLDETQKQQMAKAFRSDPSFAWPEPARAAAATANEKTAQAISGRRAAAFDSAATAWAAVAQKAGAGPAQVEARKRAYEQRVLAYASGAGETRKSAAVEALRRYLEIAPPGPDRERAQKVLNSLTP